MATVRTADREHSVGVDTGWYKLFLVLHILSVVLAFGPLLVLPILARRRDAQAARSAMAVSTRFAAPGLVGVVVFGFALVGLSDQTWKFSQSWVSIAFLLAILALGVVLLLLVPTQRQIAKAAESGDDTEALARRAAAFTGAVHLVLLLGVIDMVWKPGR